MSKRYYLKDYYLAFYRQPNILSNAKDTDRSSTRIPETIARLAIVVTFLGVFFSCLRQYGQCPFDFGVLGVSE